MARKVTFTLDDEALARLQNERIVSVLAIGVKERNVLFIGGEEFKP